jgi:serine/threonine-protein kinase
MNPVASRETEPDEALSPGDRVGRYVIRSLLGEGGMGMVYEAATDGGEPVALKLIRPSFARDPGFLKRFEREARAAASVDHSHVVNVIDVGVEGDRRFMAMELVRGGSLQDRLVRDQQLSLELTVKVGLQVASALDVLHAAGVVHRDIKPGNIMLDDDDCARVTDFGLAKQRDASVLTAMGQTIGSMDYMPPEQIRGVAELGGAADVYALGCVIYECLAGAPPFADRRGMRIMWAHLQEDPPNVCAARPEVPDGVGWAIDQALHKEPTDRPPTATAFARMVQMGARSGGAA